MELQYGNTMRLHHIDFPDQSQAIKSWEQSNQLETAPAVNSANKPFGSNKIGARSMATTAPARADQQPTIPVLGMNAANPKTAIRQGCQSVKGGAKNGKKTTAKSDGIQTNFSRRFSVKPPCHGQVNASSVSIELDVLESFQEFATFLELQNPICPAELLDTPEKLMSVLSWEGWR